MVLVGSKVFAWIFQEFFWNAAKEKVYYGLAAQCRHLLDAPLGNLFELGGGIEQILDLFTAQIIKGEQIFALCVENGVEFFKKSGMKLNSLTGQNSSAHATDGDATVILWNRKKS